MGEEKQVIKGEENAEKKEIDYLAENIKLNEKVKELKAQNSLLYQAIMNGKGKEEENNEDKKEIETDYTNDIVNYLKRNNRKEEAK